MNSCIPNKLDILEGMDKSLEALKLPKLTKEEKENMNRPIASKKTGSAIKNLPTTWELLREGDRLASQLV